ncbi:ABC transporter permease [Bacillus salacetis]|uniref:ABC transporter permease n=1 Tax=Bacillus salacetis TaxID=2315464 RepID=A0A3A1QY52_9BACI|nr:FtsX-like permease family protein [Bacillus salacetis]RIW30361.1 ABC transporter permease [Bacillus salacetis]
MNIINKLTLRHMKENKRRTLVTIIGVIISVAMVTAVATLGVSFLDLMKRQIMVNDGEWHVQYKDVNSSQINAISEDQNTEKVFLSKDLGYAALPEMEDEEKPYLFIKEYSSQGFEQFPVKLAEGRLPEAENEIVISDHFIDDSDVSYKIGDQIKFEIGERYTKSAPEPLGQNDPLQRDENGLTEELQVSSTETYKVVGIIERPEWEPLWSPGYTLISYIDSDSLGDNASVDAVVTVKDIKGTIFKDAEKLAEENDIAQVRFNNELLRLYGVTDNDNLRVTLFSLAGIIMSVIIIGSISLIYNAFAISVSERARHLGMLSSVGATKKQKRNSVFFEGSVIGLISIPIGIIAGILGIGATFLFINSFIAEALGTTEKLEVVVTPSSILIACTISIVTIFISTFIPARKASKISAIDAIRQTQDIKLSRRKVKTSKMVRKIFGLEAEIGLKNVKRNRKRYYATLFSLVISIILFLSVSFFTDSLGRSIEMSQDRLDYDIMVSGNKGDISELKSLTTLDNITSHSIQKQVQLTSMVEKDKFPEELNDLIKRENIELEDGKYQYYVNVYGMDSSSFKAFAQKAGTEAEKFEKENLTAIIVEDISYQDYESSKFIESKSIIAEPGEKLQLLNTNYETNETSPVGEITIGALTDQLPIGVHSTGIGGMDVIVPMDTFNNLLDVSNDSIEADSFLYMNSTDPMKTQEALEEVTPSSLYIYNVYQNRQREEQLVMFMSVFTYGFIALISLISIANIFNTISTSISLRKKEFAMLKSVGMTPKGFNKMINYESVFYGVNALLFGLPISFIIMYLIHRSTRETFEYGFTLPWMDLLFVIIAIFVIVSSAMLYSISKIKKENIIEGLKQDNI